jgi:Phospholipase_D-nuclease N-terminal
MSPAARAERIAEGVIHLACRRLPPDVRADRRREWAAELPAIMDDQSIRSSFRRSLRVLTFCAGISRTTRQLSRSSRAGSRRTARAQWRTGALADRPSDLAVRVLIGFAAWAAVAAGVIAFLITRPGTGPWPLLLLVVLAIGFDVYCLREIARAEQVRFLPKWAWVLICLTQVPGGGIAYLSIGHISRPRRVPPGAAKP